MRKTFWACFFIGCVVLATAECRRSAQSAARRTASSPQTAFSYEKQVGIAGRVRGDVACLAIFNDSLQPGSTIVLADQPLPNEQHDRPAVRNASIVEGVSERCDRRLSASQNPAGRESYYRIRTAAAEWQGSVYQFAIIDPKQSLSVRNGKVSGDIDEDGIPEFFRTCPSNEGVHYQVWTGAPLAGRGRWHWYVYAGYDLEYGCTDKEYFGPK